ncbi:hypothetical protein ACK36E_20305, partial [Aeromonas veronii]
NERSHWSGNGVHVEPESVFMIGRNMQAELVCTEPGLGIEPGTTFQVLSENGSEWEILLGNEYRRVNKRSGRVTGWKTPPKFECKDIQK